MKFIKGMIIGTALTAGMVMIYRDSLGMNKKKMMKNGKKFAKKMGII